MSFSSTLSIATSGLTAASIRARATAENIANANTDGYTRRVVTVEERRVGPSINGVRVANISNVTNEFLTTERLRLDADSSFASTRASAAEKLMTLVGEPGADNGLFSLYANFENALRDAAATPESDLLLRGVVDKGRALATNIQNMSRAADQQRATADRQIGLAVEEVNASLKRLEELNALPASKTTPEVIDERQRLVNSINEKIPVTMQIRDNGINLITDGGAFLLTERAQYLDFTPAGNVGRTQTLGSPLSGLSINGVDITPGGGAGQQTRSGELAGLFEVRDTILPDFQDQLDALATDLINRFADDTVDPTKTAGQSGLFTDGTTTPPTGVPLGIANSLQINAAVDPQKGGATYRLRDGIGATSPGATGNGDQLNRYISAFTSQRTTIGALATSGTRSASELAADMSSNISFQERDYSESSLFASTRAEAATEAEFAATGVDTDTELQQLLLIEQAYAANARVIQIAGQMIDELMGLI
ncbi:flagellar hook-associated protein FlgK [Parvularcula sp. LCG005]|uniref:flagellar hook-associated protein FlgK n=1 Tax=Parvularcula sp. LCG005 TaxID=3078805 RepID=UPI002943B790|nr:flagellar hook-associated protein FlgK [Parvularcula sp. LCG005]WOI52703.1 flagellar hook-associated protein FlgK [Parvularcula sp. LCG005]